jgi:hypothetical protein
MTVDNTYLEPEFKTDSYELSDTSPAVGRGVDSLQVDGTWYYAPDKDLAGNDRPHVTDPHVDLGAYESGYPRVLNNVADLFDLGLAGHILDPLFDKDTLKYILPIADTNVSPPVVRATAADALAWVDIVNAKDLTSENDSDRTSTITVTSSDSTEQKDYQVTFFVASTDATLDTLFASKGRLSPEFEPLITDYFDTIYSDTNEIDVPEVTYATSHPNATAEVMPARRVTVNAHPIDRTTYLLITPEFGSPTKTYKILFTLINTVSIENIADGPLLSLYPNPNNDLLTIETNQPGQYSIKISSLNGQLLYTDRMEGPTHQIDLSSFQKGLYLITVRSRDYLRTEKIIKQ